MNHALKTIERFLTNPVSASIDGSSNNMASLKRTPVRTESILDHVRRIEQVIEGKNLVETFKTVIHVFFREKKRGIPSQEKAEVYEFCQS